MDEKQVKTASEVREILARGFEYFGKDIESHKKAIDRLQENQEAQQAKLVEFASMLNEHSKLLEDIQRAWTKNFADQGALLNQQTRVLEAMRALVLPDEPVN